MNTPLCTRILFLIKLVSLQASWGITSVLIGLPFIHTSAQRQHKLDNLFRSKDLPAGAIQAMCQDHIGYIWIGTDIGLTRYDGKTLYHIPNPGLLANDISALTEDNKGLLWAGSKVDGISLIQTSTGKITGRLLHDSSHTGSLLNNHVHSMFKTHSGTIWVGVDSGISVFSFANGVITCNNILLDPHKRIPEMKHASIDCLTEDSKGYVWANAGEGGILILDGKSRQIIHRIERRLLSGDKQWFQVEQIFPETDSTLLICTSEGLQRIYYDHVRSNYVVKKIQLRIDNKPVKSLLVVGLIKYADRYWLNTCEGAIIEGCFSVHPVRSRPDSFIGHVIYDKYPRAWKGMFEDREGGIWVPMSDQVTSCILNYYHPLKQRFQILAEDIGKRSAIASIYTADNVHIFLGTHNGLFLYNDNSGTSTEVRDVSFPSGTGVINAICQHPDGRLFCATGRGIKQIIRYRDTYRLTTPHAFPEWKAIAKEPILRMTSFNDSLFLFTTSQFLYVWNSKHHKLARYVPQHASLPPNGKELITSLFIDSRNNIWLGTHFGISLFNPVNHTFTNYTYESGKPNRLSASDIYGITDDGHNLWLSPYNGGFYLFDRDSGAFRHYDAKDGLLGTSVCSLIQGQNRDIWISTEQGLSVFNTTTRTFRIYDREECFNNNIFMTQVGFRKNDTLYFGGGGGVTRLNAVFPYNHYVPPIAVTQISVSTSDGQTSNLKIGDDGDIVLASDQKILDIAFASLSYLNPSHNQYAYWLEGIQDNWYQLGYRSEITLAGLPPGNYRLHIKGSNNDGVWNNDGITLSLKVMPRYWQTTWFRAILALIIILALFFLIRGYYLARLRKQMINYEKQLAVHEERKRISRDMHDDLGASLTSIQLQIDGIKWKNENKEHNPELTKISKLVRQLVESMREIIWALNPDDDNLESTLLYIRKYFLNVMEKTNIQTRVLYPDVLAETDIPVEARRHLFLCVKEALNNVIKHSAATIVVLQAQISNNRLSLRISDNGSPTLSDSGSFSNGLRNMQRRMGIIGGICIISFNSHGTVVQLEMEIV